MKRLYAFLLVLTCLPLVGCSGMDPEELMLLKNEDPRFEQLIDVKERASTKISGLKDQLSNERKQLEMKMNEYKTVFKDHSERMQKEMSTLKDQTTKNRELYLSELQDLEQRLGEKRDLMTGLSETLKDVSNAINRKTALGFSDAEIRNWQQRRFSLEQRVVPLNEEVAKLESEISLRRKKLKYL
jgi:chromosome segregation ATPase